MPRLTPAMRRVLHLVGDESICRGLLAGYAHPGEVWSPLHSFYGTPATIEALHARGLVEFEVRARTTYEGWQTLARLGHVEGVVPLPKPKRP